MAMNTPRPKWFISRGADIYTALIPADELPTNVNIQGVSRNMTVDQVVGMTLVAETGKSTQRYSLDKTPYLPGLGVDSVMSSPVLSPSRNFFAPTTPQSKQFLAPDTNVAVGAPTKIFPSDGARNVPKTVEQPSQVTVVPTPRTESIAVAKFDGYRPDGYYPLGRPPPPSGREPDETRKIYCSYWLHFGSCDYTQQGCKYKHEMPRDSQTLKSLGFRDTPRWYLEEQAANKGRLQGLAMHRTRVKQLNDLSARSSLGSTVDSTASSNKASVREESNTKLKRHHFTESAPTGVLRYKSPGTTGDEPLVTKLPPPVITRSTVPKPESPASKNVAVITAPRKPARAGRDLIDLDSEEESCSTVRPSSSASTTVSSHSSSVVDSASESESTLTPLPVNAPTATPTEDERASCSTSESSTSRKASKRSKKTFRPSKKAASRPSSKTASPITAATFVSPSSNGKHTTGLSASAHASPTVETTVASSKKPVSNSSSKTASVSTTPSRTRGHAPGLNASVHASPAPQAVAVAGKN